MAWAAGPQEEKASITDDESKTSHSFLELGLGVSGSGLVA